MRLFTAIEIPSDVKERLRAFVDPLRPLAKLSWSPVENLHITTKFIGEWPDERLPEITAALQSIPKTGDIAISIRGLGWFPNEKNPRVFWAGVISNNSLATLAHSTEQAVAALGVPVEERNYSPHLTLARIRDHVPLGSLRNAVASARSDFGTLRATHFALYLSAAGKYRPLATFPLS